MCTKLGCFVKNNLYPKERSIGCSSVNQNIVKNYSSWSNRLNPEDRINRKPDDQIKQKKHKTQKAKHRKTK